MAEGLDFLAEAAEAHDVNLSWVYDISTGVSTIFEPICGKHVPYDIWDPFHNWYFEWIDDALSFLGYSQREWEGVFHLANDMRKQYHANWGFSTFVVMDENDPDYRFSDFYDAYTSWYQYYTGGPDHACFLVMTYNNGGWMPQLMDRVFRHEICHVVLAADEYCQPERCGCTEVDCAVIRYGYLSIVNGNCQVCNPSPVNCSMFNLAPTHCSYTLGHIGWRDTDGDGPADPIDPNNGGWMSIFPVSPGDLVRIFTIGGEFVGLISVTNDNMFVGSSGHVIWDGHTYDNQLCPLGIYLVSINGGSTFSRPLQIADPSANPIFANIGYSNGKLSWTLTTSFANVRCFIYDESQNLIVRPIWDKYYAPNYPQTLSLGFLEPGHNYTARFYGWWPDGAASATVNYPFFLSCVGKCGDANADNVVNVSDATYIINYVFTGGSAPKPVLACGDANTDRSVNVSDAGWIINFVFAGGNPPGNCSPGTWPPSKGDCCPYAP